MRQSLRKNRQAGAPGVLVLLPGFDYAEATALDCAQDCPLQQQNRLVLQRDWLPLRRSFS